MTERKTYTAEDFKGCNGRRVLVEGVIDDTSPETTECIRVLFPSFSEFIPEHADVGRSAIVAILPEEIKVGDRVKWCGEMGRILHIDGDVAWLRADCGANHILNLSDLTLVENS